MNQLMNENFLLSVLAIFTRKKLKKVPKLKPIERVFFVLSKVKTMIPKNSQLNICQVPKIKILIQKFILMSQGLQCAGKPLLTKQINFKFL